MNLPAAQPLNHSKSTGCAPSSTHSIASTPGCPAGHVLWQGACQHEPESGIDRLVAVFCWAGAAKRLRDRDEWIGWDAVTCADRLKLVVQLRRFVIIGEHASLNQAFIHYADHQSEALRLLTQKPPYHS